MTFTTPAPPVGVLVVDDSRPFRDGAHTLINGTAGFEWLGEADCGEEGVEQAARLAPDLVLMDVRMPGIGGVEAARTIAARGLPAVVVLVTGAEPPNDVPDCTVAAVLQKDRLSQASLRRLWAEVGTRRS